MTRFCTECGQPTTAEAPNHYLCANRHHNYLDAVPAGVAYVLKDNQVLFGVRSREPKPGKLNTPGGFLDLTESAENATLREVREELGLEVEIVDYLGSYSAPYDEGKQQTLNIVFVTKYLGGEPTPGDDMDGGTPVWRRIDDLPAASELSFDYWQVQAQKDLQAWYAAHKLL